MRRADAAVLASAGAARSTRSPRGVGLAAVLLAVGSAVSMLQLRDNAITDPFHYGEYFSYFTSLRLGTFAGQAISLHGALEYFPAFFARGLAGPGHDLFWTIVFLSSFGVLSAALFVGAASELLRSSPYRYPVLPVLALLTPLLMSSREVFLFASLWLATRLLHDRGMRPAARRATEVGLGIAVALGIFWSFDRGIAQVIAIGAPAVLILVRRPTFRIATVACIACIGVLGLGTRVFSVAGYVDNLRFILDVSGQFSYGWTRESVILKAGGLAITIVVMGLMLVVARRARDEADPSIALMLAMLCAAVLRVVSYRADIWHFPAMLWAPALALVWAHARLVDTPDRRLLDAAIVAIGVVLALLGLEFVSFGKLIFVAAFALLAVLAWSGAGRWPVARRWAVHAVVVVSVLGLVARWQAAVRDGGFAWVARTASTPTNAAVAPDEMNAIAAALAAHRVRCVMDMSNRGLLNGLLDLPSCTRMTYPVYATAKYEDEMIGQLDASRVPALVYSATTWSYRIDDVPMTARFPKLDAFIRSRYPILACTPQYCIRSMGPAA